MVRETLAVQAAPDVPQNGIAAIDAAVSIIADSYAGYEVGQ